MSNKDFESKETVEEVLSYPFKDYPERGISKETCERFGVRCAVDPTDGKTPTAFYFPSYNKKGKLVGFMKQDITKDKEEKGHWTAIGSVSISNKMFGQDVAEGVERQRKMLVITEGQWDTLSVYQAFVDNVKGTKWDSLEPFVVSIPLGTANAAESVLQNFDFVTSFSEVALFFDNDEATPREKKKGILKGKEAAESVFSTLVGEGIGLFQILAPEGYKDASDYMQAGEWKALAKLVSFGKKEYTPEKIVKVSDVTLEEILTKRKDGAMVPEFPELMNKIRGFRTGELVTLTSASGVGKSTCTSIIADAMLGAGFKVGMMFLEETKEETIQRFMAKRLGVSYVEFKENPFVVAEKEDIERVYNELTQSDNIVILDHFGSIPVEDLMSKIKYMHYVEKCDFIFIDHAGMLTARADIQDERRTLDIVITELAAFCASNPCGILLVSHINRSAAEQFKPPKIKEGEEPKPYWIQVSKEMMRSSAALEQLSWIVLGLEPRIEPDRSRGPVRFTVLKNRSFSATGVADVFMLNERTWEVEPFEEEEF